MKLEIFKAEDFKKYEYSVCESLQASDRANYIFNKWLEDNGVNVFAKKGMKWDTDDGSKDHTHKALLICIEEIPKKECKHKEAVYVETKSKSWWKCRDCDKALKATKWEALETFDAYLKNEGKE